MKIVYADMVFKKKNKTVAITLDVETSKTNKIGVMCCQGKFILRAVELPVGI